MDKVKAKKYLGQHFLTDKNIAQKIVESLSDNNTNIVEIGPGMGVLTEFLIQKTHYCLKVIEIDNESVVYLQQHYPTLNDKIVNADFLKIDLKNIFTDNFAVIGNFPYNISSQILFKIIDYRQQITEVVGMFQKEVAVRVAAMPEGKEYGILSVLLQAYYDIEYLFTVHENVFSPPPKVKSAVIRLKRNNVQKLECDEQQFKLIVKTAFNQRRKTIRNSLKSILFEEGFVSNPIFDKRPERLSVADFIYLTQHTIAEK